MNSHLLKVSMILSLLTGAPLSSFAESTDLCGVLTATFFNGKIDVTLDEVPLAFHNGNGPQKVVRISNPEVLEGRSGSCVCASGFLEKDTDPSWEITDKDGKVLSQKITIELQMSIDWAPKSDTAVYGKNCRIMSASEIEAHQKKLEDEEKAAISSQDGPG